MWLTITPKKFENEKIEARAALAGVLETKQLHVQTSDISTVAFGDGIAQIRLSSGRILGVVAPDEIASLRRLIEGESGAEYQAAMTRALAITQRAMLETVSSYMAEDNSISEAKGEE